MLLPHGSSMLARVSMRRPLRTELRRSPDIQQLSLLTLQAGEVFIFENFQIRGVEAPTAVSATDFLNYKLESDTYRIIATGDLPRGDHSVHVDDVKVQPCLPAPVLTVKVAVTDLDLGGM